MKRKVFIVIFIIFVMILIIYRYNNNRLVFSIDAPIKMYNLRNPEIKEKYIKYLANYLQPKKLQNFIDINYIYFNDYVDNITGKEILEQIKYKSYINLFNYMFNINTADYDICPVSDEFKDKFKIGILKYYKFDLLEDTEVSCDVDIDNLEIQVMLASDFYIGDPNNIQYFDFNYIQDENGNIVDIIKGTSKNIGF